MPWTGVTVCPVGNGMAAPLVTVLTERWIAGEQSQGDKCRRATGQLPTPSSGHTRTPLNGRKRTPTDKH